MKKRLGRQPKGFLVRNTVNLSELSSGTLLEHRGELITVEDLRKMLSAGCIPGNVYTVTESCITNILHQAYSDYQNGIASNTISANNYGRRVILDT